MWFMDICHSAYISAYQIWPVKVHLLGHLQLRTDSPIISTILSHNQKPLLSSKRHYANTHHSFLSSLRSHTKRREKQDGGAKSKSKCFSTWAPWRCMDLNSQNSPANMDAGSGILGVELHISSSFQVKKHWVRSKRKWYNICAGGKKKRKGES